MTSVTGDKQVIRLRSYVKERHSQWSGAFEACLRCWRLSRLFSPWSTTSEIGWLLQPMKSTNLVAKRTTDRRIRSLARKRLFSTLRTLPNLERLRELAKMEQHLSSILQAIGNTRQKSTSWNSPVQQKQIEIYLICLAIKMWLLMLFKFRNQMLTKTS